MSNFAVIFDLDGVVADTQTEHAKADHSILNRYGVSPGSTEITRLYAGVPTRTIFSRLLSTIVAPEVIEQLVEEKRADVLRRVQQNGVDAIPGAVKLIRLLFSSSVPLAIGSASNRTFVDLVLTKVGVIQYFDQIVTGDQITKGKPDPETFLVAALRLKVAPRNCIVVEDGLAGMQAAASAGMKCLALVPDTEGDYPTPYRVTSLETVTLDFINNLI